MLSSPVLSPRWRSAFLLTSFWSPDSKPAATFESAFWGAFLAFIFVRTGEALNRLYEASRFSRKALGQIQFLLNEAMSIGSDNLYKLDDWNRFIEAARHSRQRQSVPVWGNRLTPIPSTKAFLIDVMSIGLVNELFLLESSIRKLNDSMDTWQRAYETARNSFMSKSIDAPTYLANVEQSNAKVGELRMFIDDLIHEVMSALSATRLLMKHKPLLVKINGWLNPDQYKTAGQLERQEELAKLRQEAKEIGEESKQRIARVAGAAAAGGNTDPSSLRP